MIMNNKEPVLYKPRPELGIHSLVTSMTLLAVLFSIAASAGVLRSSELGYHWFPTTLLIIIFLVSRKTIRAFRDNKVAFLELSAQSIRGRAPYDLLDNRYRNQETTINFDKIDFNRSGLGKRSWRNFFMGYTLRIYSIDGDLIFAGSDAFLVEDLKEIWDRVQKQ